MSVRVAGIPVVSTLLSLAGIPLSTALPMTAVTILSVWAANCTPEASPVHKSAPEVSHIHESAPVPPELAASTAEPPELMVSTAEPPELAVSTADPPKPAAAIHELIVCPVTAKEGIHKLTVCPVNLSVLSVLAPLLRPGGFLLCSSLASCFAGSDLVAFCSRLAPCSVIFATAPWPRSTITLLTVFGVGRGICTAR